MTAHAPIQIEYHSASTAVVALCGTLGRAVRQDLAAVLAEAGACATVVVDLTRTQQIDPSLVNAVQQAAERLIGTPGRLEIVIPARAHALRSLFETVGATSIAGLHATLSQALAALEPGRPGRRAA